MTDVGTKYALATPKGLFVNITPLGLMTERALGIFERYVDRVQGPDANTLRDVVLPLLKSLPRAMCRFDSPAQNDVEGQPKKDWRGRTLASTVSCLAVGGWAKEETRFIPRSARPFSPDPSSWHWHTALALLAHNKLLQKHAALCEVTVSTSILRACKRRQNDLDAGTLTVRLPEPSLDLGQARPCAVYQTRADGKGGYLDAKFRPGLLATAQLYETAAAAERELRKRYRVSTPEFTNLAIVQTELTITGVVPRATETPFSADLSSAVAEMNKRQIEQALAQADIDTIRRRLAELEADQPAPESAVQRPKRM